jgi:hypothetical protein
MAMNGCAPWRWHGSPGTALSAAGAAAPGTAVSAAGTAALLFKKINSNHFKVIKEFLALPLSAAIKKMVP